MDAKKSPYNYMTWEIDTTGKYLCDEIFHMSCLFNGSKFDIYIMPHRNITFYQSRKYQVCTTRRGHYRYLLRKKLGKIIRSRTEIFALEAFLKWLRLFADKPIVLMTYEPYEFAPFILLQALERHGMVEEFKDLVYGFAHAHGFVKKKCKKSMISLNFPSLTKILLNKNDIECYDSLERVEQLNAILLHLCDGRDILSSKDILALEMQPYIKCVPVVKEELQLKLGKVALEVSLRPIFLPYFKCHERRRMALFVRNILVHLELDYSALRALWNEGVERFKEEICELLTNADQDVLNITLEILFCHFDNIESQ